MSPEIDLLTTLSTQPFSACEAQWQQLLHRLFLPISFVPAIQAVLEKGRWKSQPDPMAYVRKSSLRSAVRLGILDVRRNSRREVLATDLNFAGLHLKDADGKSLGHDDRLGTALHRHDEQFRTPSARNTETFMTKMTSPTGCQAASSTKTLKSNGTRSPIWPRWIPASASCSNFA